MPLARLASYGLSGVNGDLSSNLNPLLCLSVFTAQGAGGGTAVVAANALR